jgi:hypothetical protein
LPAVQRSRLEDDTGKVDDKSLTSGNTNENAEEEVVLGDALEDIDSRVKTATANYR